MKPIILTTREIRGLLDGSIDTIRREIKPQPAIMAYGKRLEGYSDEMIRAAGEFPKAPFQPGDVLYCRESWHMCYDSTFRYAATDPPNKGWSSPATMPRHAARLFLSVEDVRAERVQEITPLGAWNEGCRIGRSFPWEEHIPDLQNMCRDIVYKSVWDERNAKHGLGWDTNPWTWVYTVKTISAEDARGIDLKSEAKE